MALPGGIERFRRISGRPARRRSAALSYVRQLCISGIDSHRLAPYLVEGVRELIGGDWGGFCWPDEQDRIADMYVENAEMYRLGPIYAREFGGTHLERDAFGVDFPLAMRTGRGWQNLDLHRERLKRSPYFNELFYPLGIRHGIEATASQGGRGWAALVLYRGAGGAPFRGEDLQTLARISPLIAHAVRAPPLRADALAESEESGLLLADALGRIVLANDGGCSLLLNLLDDECCSADIDASHVPPRLLPLVHGALRLARGLQSAPPIGEVDNRWGRFTVRAYAMQAPAEGPASLVALHVRRFEALPVRVLHNAWRMGLSARQREVCVHIAAGRSYAEIAALMSVRVSTVIDHVRKVYMQLDVHDQDGLLAVLSTATANAGTSAGTRQR